ncbi:hypothetical protein LTR66_015421 [Elasticomyces elasticus]|nr:hypothetical protein LTR66_015421 [Elasticomyces elasticus]
MTTLKRSLKQRSEELIGSEDLYAIPSDAYLDYALEMFIKLCLQHWREAPMKKAIRNGLIPVPISKELKSKLRGGDTSRVEARGESYVGLSDDSEDYNYLDGTPPNKKRRRSQDVAQHYKSQIARKNNHAHPTIEFDNASLTDMASQLAVTNARADQAEADLAVVAAILAKEHKVNHKIPMLTKRDLRQIDGIDGDLAERISDSNAFRAQISTRYGMRPAGKTSFGHEHVRKQK